MEQPNNHINDVLDGDYQTRDFDPEMIHLLTRIFFAVARELLNYLEDVSAKNLRRY